MRRARWLKEHQEPTKGTMGYAYPAPAYWGNYWCNAWIFVPDGGDCAYPAEPGEDFEFVDKQDS